MSSLKIQFWSLNSIRLNVQISIAFPLRLKHTWYIIQFPCTKYKFVNVHFDHGLKYNNTGKYASFREVLSDICFWVLYCSRVMYVYVYLGQFARDSPQCNQFCVNFIQCQKAWTSKFIVGDKEEKKKVLMLLIVVNY